MNADVVFSSNGKLYVVWEDMNSGTVKYKSGTYTVSGTTEQSGNHETARVYPNPSLPSGFYVQFEMLDDAQVSYRISDAQGRPVASGSGKPRMEFSK